MYMYMYVPCIPRLQLGSQAGLIWTAEIDRHKQITGHNLDTLRSHHLLTLMWTSWTPELRTFNGNDFDSVKIQITFTNVNTEITKTNKQLIVTHTNCNSQTSSLYDAKIHQLPREVQSAVVWHFDLHRQHYGGTARVTCLDANERRVVGSYSTKEVGLGYCLGLKGTNLLQ